MRSFVALCGCALSLGACTTVVENLITLPGDDGGLEDGPPIGSAEDAAEASRDAPSEDGFIDAGLDVIPDVRKDVHMDAATDSAPDVVADAPTDAPVDAPSGCTSNAACADGSFCEKATGDCGGFGACVLKPALASCTFGATVCGCDSKNYGSPCHAHALGINVSTSGACP